MRTRTAKAKEALGTREGDCNHHMLHCRSCGMQVEFLNVLVEAIGMGRAMTFGQTSFRMEIQGKKINVKVLDESL